jgi:predicted ATPase
VPGSRARRVLSAAAERARLRFANREAMGYLEVAVALLARLPDDDERRRQQLEIRLRLGALLIDLRGFASEPVRENYERAAELCPAVGREAQHFEVAYARWYLQVARGERDQAIAGAAQMETLARRLGNWQRAVAA